MTPAPLRQAHAPSDRVGGVLDDRDAAADLRDRLQRELDARELARH